jgi:hypothetical protein
MQIDCISKRALSSQALSAAQAKFPTAATGHTHTRGEGVILGNAPNKRCDQLPRQPHQSRCQSAPIPALYSRRTIQERIGLRRDPQVYPCEYVSQRRHLTTHALLAVAAMLKINRSIIADRTADAHPPLV